MGYDSAYSSVVFGVFWNVDVIEFFFILLCGYYCTHSVHGCVRVVSRYLECFVDFTLVVMALVAFITAAVCLDQPTQFTNPTDGKVVYFTLISFWQTYSHTVSYNAMIVLRTVCRSSWGFSLSLWSNSHAPWSLFVCEVLHFSVSFQRF